MRPGPQLKIVANVAVGYNNVDVAACRARGIAVTNTPDVLTNACADFTWGLILAITRRLGEGERVVRAGEWGGWALDYMLGMELRGKQLGLVGVGRIGGAVADKAPAFGMTVAYTATQGPPTSRTRSQMPLDRLLATSDVDLAACPMTPETKHLIDQKALTKMKRTRVSDQHLARAGRRRGGAGVGAQGTADCRRGARRLRKRAGDSSGLDVARERAADSAPRQRDHRNPHRDG